VEPTAPYAIDIVESAYDLDKPDATWLRDLIEVGAPVWDHGPGVFGFEFVRPPPGGTGAEVVIRNPQLRSLPADFPERLGVLMRSLPPELVQIIAPPGYAGTWRGLIDECPEAEAFPVEDLGYEDLFAILAVDPNGVGVEIIAPLDRATRLAPRTQERWRMLCAHVATAYRLRNALARGAGSRLVQTDLPRDAEAVLDAKGFRLVDVAGPAKEHSAGEVLRDAALRVDRSRGKLRRQDPELALQTWTALVDGRWSLVDWFDTDQRRFILAIPNPPEIRDPRGLTEQEAQVVTYATFGEPNKLIAYRLGLSQPRVSALVKSAMHKLGAKSKAELVRKLQPLGESSGPSDHESRT
jgi:DNA-binding CsgD family transcriptional regulator